MEKRWDLMGIGCAAIDDLLFVDVFPAADSKARVKSMTRQGGWLVATALVASARLGLKTAYAGILGYDEESQWVENDLKREGVDVSPVVHRADAMPIHAYIVVDENHTRTILFHQVRRVPGIEDFPEKETIQATCMLLIDDTTSPEILKIAALARSLGIPVIADFEREPSQAMTTAVDHLIVPAHLALDATQTSDPREATRLLWHEQREVVIVTVGAKGCWYYTGGGGVLHHPAFEVDVVDTTGCGDVFHGAYAVGLNEGWDIEQRIRFASAAAAIKATHPGGRQGIPNRAEVEVFLNEQQTPN
jgi:ribokinase